MGLIDWSTTNQNMAKLSCFIEAQSNNIILLIIIILLITAVSSKDIFK